MSKDGGFILWYAGGVGTSTVLQAFLEGQPHIIFRSYCVKGAGRLLTRCYGSPRPLASLLRETNYASLTTECLTVPGVCTVPNTRPTTEWTSALLFNTTRARRPGETNPFVHYCRYSIQYNVRCRQMREQPQLQYRKAS